MRKEFGRHFLVEFIGCDAEKIKYVDDVKEIFLRAAEKSNATILNSCFHQFDPAGVSGLIFIAESHFSIHTWPEESYAAFDVFTCGEMQPELAIEEMRQGFCAQKVEAQIIPRGFDS